MAEQTMTKKKGLKKGWRIVLGILAGLILLYAVLGVLPRRENHALANPMMKEGALPLLIAHGGGNKEFPANTLEAFYNASVSYTHLNPPTLRRSSFPRRALRPAGGPMPKHAWGCAPRPP